MGYKDQEEFMDEFVEDPPNENEANGDPPNKGRPNRGRPLPPMETRWKKGVSGNPRGRPKKRDTLTDLIRQLLRKYVEPIERSEPGENCSCTRCCIPL